MIFIIIILLIFFIVKLLNRLSEKKKVINGFINMYFGKRRQGKSTHAAYVVSVCNRHAIPCFSNVPIHNCYQLGDSISEADYPPGSVIIIDEAGLVWGNRDFKNMSKDVIEFFKMSGHHKYTIYLYSQQYDDCDKKIRDLTDKLVQVKKEILGFSRFTTWHTVDGVDEDGQPDLKYIAPTFLSRLFSFRLFRPKYYKLFDSHCYVPTEHARGYIPW